MLCWIVSVNIFHPYLLTSTTGLDTRLWNLNRAKDSLLWRKRRSSLALQVTEPTKNAEAKTCRVELGWVLVTSLRLLLQFSTSYMCKFRFSAMTTIKHKKRERLLSVEEKLCVSLWIIWPKSPKVWLKERFFHCFLVKVNFTRIKSAT